MENATEVLERMRQAPVVDLRTITDECPFLVLAPHPDDESLGCGGLLAAHAAPGTAHVCVLTDGSASHPAMAWEVLRDLREAETLAACNALGVPGERLTFLRCRDGDAPRHGRKFAAVVDRLCKYSSKNGITTILATWCHDPHTDHKAAAAIAREVALRTGARLWFYPIWGWTLTSRSWLPSGAGNGVRVDIAPFLDLKRRAIGCHGSQVEGVTGMDARSFRLSGEFQALFDGRYETFLTA